MNAKSELLFAKAEQNEVLVQCGFSIGVCFVDEPLLEGASNF